MSVKNPDDLGAAAVPYLSVVGHLVYSYLWARMARVALDGEGPAKGTFYKAKLSTARLYFAKPLRETAFQIRRSEEHTSELQSLMRTSYAVLDLKKKQHSTLTHKIYS